MQRLKSRRDYEEERQFLKDAAGRHNVFNYRNIAEYYAHATPEMQRLMEKSALVIIDINNAIANGYASLFADVLDTMRMRKMRDDFVVFIITHKRPDNQITYKTLKRGKYTGKIIFVLDDGDDTIDAYCEKYGKENITGFSQISRILILEIT